MEDKYIMLNLEDDKAKQVAEAISSPSCKKILELLAEKEASESDIANQLRIPLNTAEYNIKKLEQAGLIEKAKHFWSVKGKKIHHYRLANKYIVIAPKKSVWNKIKPILPALIITGIIAFIIKIYFQAGSVAEKAGDSFQGSEEAVMSAASSAPGAIQNMTSVFTSNYWTWYFLGALTAIVILLIWLLKKQN